MSALRYKQGCAVLVVRVVESIAGASRAAELKAVLEAQRAGLPILVLRRGEEGQRVFVLEPDDEQLWVGRGSACDVCIASDDKASRCHAELVRVAEGWAVVDDGLSRNGTFVDGQRVAGRRRLHDGDAIRLGGSVLTYRLAAASGAPTRPATDVLAMPHLTARQHEVLVLLCRPLWSAASPAVPASNKAIADALFLSVPAVVTHMRALFERFAIEDVPQNQKRALLAERAILAGAVSERDL